MKTHKCRKKQKYNNMYRNTNCIPTEYQQSTNRATKYQQSTNGVPAMAAAWPAWPAAMCTTSDPQVFANTCFKRKYIYERNLVTTPCSAVASIAIDSMIGNTSKLPKPDTNTCLFYLFMFYFCFSVAQLVHEPPPKQPITIDTATSSVAVNFCPVVTMYVVGINVFLQNHLHHH